MHAKGMKEDEGEGFEALGQIGAKDIKGGH